MSSNSKALEVTYGSIDDLKPYERNARTHNRKQIRQIADSIKSFGFTNPVLLNQNTMILAGHGRVEAAKLLGLTTVPTICLDHLTEDQVRAYILTDNRLAEKAGWDKSILAVEFQYLETLESDFDITVTGFELPEIEQLIGISVEGDSDDDAVEPKGPAVTRRGNLWLLGDHRLLCGDATSAEDFTALMDGKKAAMSFTDPPYNVDYANSAKDKLRGTNRPILNDNLGDAFGSFLQAVCGNILCATDGATYLCMSSSELHTLNRLF